MEISALVLSFAGVLIAFVLGLLSAWYATRYARFHDLRVDALVGLYSRLTKVQRAFKHARQRILLGGNAQQIEADRVTNRNKAADRGNDLIEWADEKRLLFNPELRNAVDKYIDGLGKAWMDQDSADILRSVGVADHVMKAVELDKKVDEFVNTETPKLREVIEVIVREELRAPFELIDRLSKIKIEFRRKSRT